MQKILTEKEREELTYYYKSPRFKNVVAKRCPKEFNLLNRTSGDYSDLIEEYFSGSGDGISKNRKVLNEKKYLTGDIGVSYRLLSYWAENDILPEGVEVDGWKKFNLVELVWIRAVGRMREFGLSLDDIAEVKYWVMQWDEKEQRYPWFEFYIALAALSPFDPYIIILPIFCFAELGTTEDIEKVKMGWDFSPNISKSMLLVSFKEILNELDIEVKSARLLFPLVGLDREIHNTISFNLEGYKELTIRLKRGGGVSEIIKSKTYSDAGDIEELKSKKLKEDDFFADVVQRYSNGKVQSVEVRERKKIK
jgi:DNA-binding transcriptional MerR regulator